MTKNGTFCAVLFVVLFSVSLTAAAAVDVLRGWFAMWLIIVSVTSFIGAFVAAYAAIGDYLMENEE